MTRPPLAATLAILAVLVVAAPAAASGPQDDARPGAGAHIDQKPRIVEVDGFAYRSKRGKPLRVAALVLSRYPDVHVREFPRRLRKQLRFRARAKLDIYDGEHRIARSRDAGALPVASRKHSVFWVHLLSFTRSESRRILAAAEPTAKLAQGAGDRAGEAAEGSARSVLAVTANGRTLARAHAERSADVPLPEKAPPKVVAGCAIEPGTRCLHANLSRADLAGAQLSRAYLMSAYLGGTNLARADLTRANLIRASLSDANLTGATLVEANLTEAFLYRATLAGADLTRASLHRANLLRADLSGANLTRVNLSGDDTNLNEANLTGANLTGANATGAYFRGANLRGANLSGAKLVFTDLSGADLSGADVTGADLAHAKLWHTTCPDGKLTFSPDTCG